jgi:hypothetical protein
MANTETKKSSPLLIAAAWAIVILPTAWGLRYTLQSAMKIFTEPAASAAPSQTPR